MRMRCCDICTTRKNCGDCPYIDGYVGPKTRMAIALKQGEIPDELSPDEIWTLVDLVMDGHAGNGDTREYMLGKWYRIVQTIVNRKIDLKTSYYGRSTIWFRHLRRPLSEMCRRVRHLVESHLSRQTR